nr:hypothetical protein [Tanacetum cinerariifolium]
MLTPSGGGLILYQAYGVKERIPNSYVSGGTFPVLVGFWLDMAGRDVLEPRCTHTADVDELKNKQLKKHMDMIMKVVRSDDKMSQMLTQLQSPNDVGSGSGSGRSGDDEDAAEDKDKDADGGEDS